MAKLITAEEFEIAVAYLRVLILTSAGKGRQKLKPRCLGVVSRKPADWEIESELVWDPPRLTINKTANFIWDPGALTSAVYNIDELSSPASGTSGYDAKGSPGPLGWFVYFRVGEGELGEVLVALHGEYGDCKVTSTRKARTASNEMACRRAVARVLSERGIEVSAGRREAREGPKLPPPHMLPGPNFVRTPVRGGGYTRISTPAKPIQEPEPEKEPTLVWGDYSALVEAIERAGGKPKRKQEKPEEPKESESKRHNLWSWALIAFELLAIVWICHIYATQGPYSSELTVTCGVAALTGAVGIALLRGSDSPDD